MGGAKDTQGPYAESSSLKDDVVRSVAGMPGVGQAANITYFTMQVQAQGGKETRAMVVGIEPGVAGLPGQPGHLVAGRHLVRSHHEAVADVKTGFAVGDKIRIRRHDYEVVGWPGAWFPRRRPHGVHSLKDAQEAQFLKDNDAIVNERTRTAANPAFNRPGVPGLLDAVRPAKPAAATSMPCWCGWPRLAARAGGRAHSAAGNTSTSTPAPTCRRFW